jgi:threonyl-tRNA synthetase
MRMCSAPTSRWPPNACRINDLILSVYQDFGFKEIVVKLSTRPEKRVGTDALWDRAESVMTDVLKTIEAQSEGRIKTGILPGEGAFYGPKFEYTLKDAIGREWQCGTTQVDFNLPERFGAFYIDSNSEKTQPVMIHRAICGSMERFLGILIENFAGHMPLWISPQQIVVATITSEADAMAPKWPKPCATPASPSRPTSATRRSTTRSANTRSPRFP